MLNVKLLSKVEVNSLSKMFFGDFLTVNFTNGAITETLGKHCKPKNADSSAYHWILPAENISLHNCKHFPKRNSLINKH